MSGTLRFLFADHLSREVSSLQDLDLEHDLVLMVEVQDEASYVPHHKKERFSASKFQRPPTGLSSRSRRKP